MGGVRAESEQGAQRVAGAVRPIVFLDIDGVLNSEAWYRRRAGLGPDEPVPSNIIVPVHTSRSDEIDPEAVARLNRLTDRTGAQLVVSSTWRMSGMDWLVPFLRRVGVTAEIIGSTPIAWLRRGHEIGAWLTDHPEVQRFVILDDDADMDGHMHRLVQTTFRHGLTDADVSRAVELLGVASSEPTS